MNVEGKEIEVKFLLSKRAEMETKLEALGIVAAPRVLEINLRFDTTDRALTAAGKVLRLRRDSRSRVTYKGPGIIEGGASKREEFEFTVSDFDTAKALFEALGFHVYTIYEKYRTTYQLGKTEVDLDELPTGDFLEIEGVDADSVQKIAKLLGLRWEARVVDSYTVLFDRARQALGLVFRDLSFDNFKGISVAPEAMGISPADVINPIP